jgi:hypothetical protein
MKAEYMGWESGWEKSAFAPFITHISRIIKLQISSQIDNYFSIGNTLLV